MSNVPCKTCPWRVGSNPDDIPGFSLEQARGLRKCVGRGDDFRTIMACHGSAEGADTPCVGYLAREGYSNLAVRLMAMDGKIDLPAIVEACSEIELYEDYDAMQDNIEEHYA